MRSCLRVSCAILLFLGWASVASAGQAANAAAAPVDEDYEAALRGSSKRRTTMAFAFIGFDDANNTTDGSDSFFSLAAHLEASLKIDFAPRHAIVITPVAIDIFGPALTDSESGITPEDAGLDKAGTTYAFTVGYLGRFGSGGGGAY